MKRRQLMFPGDLTDSRPVRRPGRGWDPRYLIDATPERLAREADYGRELMAQALKPPARTAKPAGTR